MSNVNSISWFRDKSEAKNVSITKNVHLNLPDLQFFHMCQKHYKVNRGVFNTIDAWIYEYGIVSIIHRRTSVLAFLDFVKEVEQDSDQQKFIRFDLVVSLVSFNNLWRILVGKGKLFKSVVSISEM